MTRMLWPALTICAGVAHAQFGRNGAEWMTDGADAQRSHWIPADAQISPESLRTAGFQFLWKTKLDNESVQLNSLTPAVLLDRYIGYRGFRSLAFLSGTSNMIYGIDTDLSRLEWQQRLSSTPPQQGTPACPGGITSNVARSLPLGYPTATPGGGGLGGRGGPARSAVGAPDEGAVTLAAALRAPAPAPAPRAPAAARNPIVRERAVYAIGADGKFHALNISNGMEPEPPVDFLPPNANARGLLVMDGVAYAVTGNCNGAPSAIWALDLTGKTVARWQPGAGSIVGAVGAALGPNGDVYVTTDSGDLFALESKALSLTGRYSAGQAFTSSPVVFPYRGKNLIAAATKDGRIHVWDGADAVAISAGSSSDGGFGPGALATWQAVDGTRWLLSAAQGPPGKVVAWRLVNQAAGVGLERGWVSRNLVAPLTPVVINGVVFAVSTGDPSTPAVIYALDGGSGRMLWDSGKAITSFVHSGGVSGGGGQIYLQTFDQTLYAFGFPMEH